VGYSFNRGWAETPNAKAAEGVAAGAIANHRAPQRSPSNWVIVFGAGGKPSAKGTVTELIPPSTEGGGKTL
jgi:hypothetical protein